MAVNCELFIVEEFNSGAVSYHVCRDERDAIRCRNLILELGNDAQIRHKVIASKKIQGMEIVDASLPAKKPQRVTDWQVVYTNEATGLSTVACIHYSQAKAEKWMARHQTPAGYSARVCDNLSCPKGASWTRDTVRYSR